MRTYMHVCACVRACVRARARARARVRVRVHVCVLGGGEVVLRMCTRVYLCLCKIVCVSCA